MRWNVTVAVSELGFHSLFKILKSLSPIALSFVFVFFLTGVGKAAIYYVAPGGLDTNPGTLAQPWLTIQKAANTLAAGDTAYVRAAPFLVAVFAQIMAKKFHPLLYWAVIVATTTAGTTMADYADRSLGIGYPGGASILFVLLMLSLGIWYWSEGSIAIETVITPRIELIYWLAIMFSQTLGTALGDWMADTAGLDHDGGALIFSAGLSLIAILYYKTKISRVLLFWSAFILTRPLGATVGDFLDKPVDHGGLAISRFTASAIIAVLMIACILIFPQKAGRHPRRKPEITDLQEPETT